MLTAIKCHLSLVQTEIHLKIITIISVLSFPTEMFSKVL